MALQRLTLDGYGQIELNQVAFRRDGRIEAQCALDATDFATIPAENGMLLSVDNVTRTIKLAKNDNFPIALNYTAEHMYDERTPGLKNFKLNRGEVLPRLGYLATGDKFTTNCVCYDDTEFAKGDNASAEATFVAALEKVGTTALYGGISDVGAIKISATKPTAGPVLLVLKKTTMPDGQMAVKFQAM